MKLTGLIAPPHTPLHSDGSLNLDAVACQAEQFVSTGIKGVFVSGSTGECQSLSLDERIALAERWVSVVRGTELKVIIQVGSNCQRDAIAMAKHAAKIEAHAIAAHAPSYFKPATVDHLIDFCSPIANATSGMPFYFYDIPILTNVRLSMVEFLTKGSRCMPNLAGLKYTNQDLMQFQQCVELEDHKFDILFGHDEELLAGLALGARGAVGSTYNFAARLYYEMISMFANGASSQARVLQARSVEMVALLARHTFAPAAKAAMKLVGIDCGPVRSPAPNLTIQQESKIHEGLRSLDVLDKPCGRGNQVDLGIGLDDEKAL